MPHTSVGARLVAAFGGESAEAAMHAGVDRLLEQAEVDGPPAPLELLGSLRGVVRIELTPMSGAGRLVPLPEGGYAIQVNEADSAGRRRFTIAHELCHTLTDEARSALSGHVDALVGAFNEERHEEFFCDVGAAHMLLHPRWLRALARGHAPSIDCLFEVASTCEASVEATARQLAVLGIWDCSFVFWEPGYRKREREILEHTPLPGLEGLAPQPSPRLRAVRVYSAPAAPFFPLRKSADPDSSITTALNGRGRASGLERFDVGGGMEAECESHYVGYVDGEGHEVPRVLTLLRWQSPR